MLKFYFVFFLIIFMSFNLDSNSYNYQVNQHNNELYDFKCSDDELASACVLCHSLANSRIPSKVSNLSKSEIYSYLHKLQQQQGTVMSHILIECNSYDLRELANLLYNKFHKEISQ